MPGAVTIATNMAGRGTDIQLGGNVDMRIERELADMPEGPERDGEGSGDPRRRRSASRTRRSPPAASTCSPPSATKAAASTTSCAAAPAARATPAARNSILSLQDDLMRIFGSERMDGMLQKLGLKEGEAIIHPWINKALEKAQKKVEARNFDIRKNLLKYDDVMNDQRKVIFEQRIELMDAESLSRDRRRDAQRGDRRPWSPRHIPEKRLCRAVGRGRPARKAQSPTSTSTCRSRSGRRKKASTRTTSASA